MNSDSLATAAALESLNDVVSPAPVAMTPQTSGWLVLAGLIVVAATWLLWRVIRHRRLTRYRREAGRELAAIEARVGQTDARSLLTELSVLLKRVALSGYGRARVASR